ncbi:MAG: hypothetical protein HOP96_06835 [Sphingomonas sp.]|nr:hypothetical protein [Sphingomonas sp.]
MHNVEFAAHEVENFESSNPDSLFGICQTVGDALGFNPFFLRVGLIGLLFFSPALMIGAYVGLGMVVGGSHLMFPKPGTPEPLELHTVERPVTVQAEAERELLAA